MSKKKRLLELINYYSGGNKTAFAAKLGTKPQSINSWLTRDTFNIDLIYSKCDGVSAEWLLTGKGPMLRDEKGVEVAATPKNDARHSVADSISDDGGATVARLLQIVEKQVDTINEQSREIRRLRNCISLTNSGIGFVGGGNLPPAAAPMENLQVPSDSDSKKPSRSGK